jgi:hypothetical protein
VLEALEDRNALEEVDRSLRHATILIASCLRG